MKKLEKRLSQHFYWQDTSFSSNKNLKNIVSHLNKKWIIITSWIIWTRKLSLLKDMIVKTKMQENFFYFNEELDINHQINSHKDLEKIYNSEKIIILENIDWIDQAEKFIQSQFKNGNKIILIWNALHIKWVAEIEILPNLSSYNRENASLIAHKIITKDIYIKQKLKNYTLLEHTIQVLAQNRKLISVREIHKILKNEWSKISQITLIEYINYIIDSKLIKKILRYDMKTNNTSTWKAKYLFTDSSIRNAIVHNSLPSDIIAENLVFQKLERKWYKVLTWKNWTFNFSFITANNKRDNIVIHISKNIEKKEVKKEAKKLLKIPWKYSKYLIINSIKEIWIRPSTYLPLKIMEIEEFMGK